MKSTPTQLEYAHAYYQEHRVRLDALHRKYCAAGRGDPMKHLTRDLKRHGISADDYMRLLDAQQGTCAICGKPETHKYKGQVQRLAVDHNHQTGYIRGLLCRDCNLLIGLAEESLDRLQGAYDYLQTHVSI